VRINDLVDEGDRGDLYHFDRVAAAPPIRGRLVRATVLEEGPVRARLQIEQELALPTELTPDRANRAGETRTATSITEVTLVAGERRVDVVTTFTNDVSDHRLRALCHVPLRAERLDVDQGLAVVGRALDFASLGSGVERPAPTGQHQRFVDISDGRRGVALFSRGLPEHEIVRQEGETAIALTLVRSVGWLARGDLASIDHAAGPMVPTPGGQELGLHRFEYAVLLHQGDWEGGEVMAESRRYAAPPIAAGALAGHGVPLGRALVEASPTSVVISAIHPAEDGKGLVVRVLNAASHPVEASLRPAVKLSDAVVVDPLERPIPDRTVSARGDIAQLTLGPWQLATILLR
jgi:mannosylglycerate hydrolase